MGPQRRDGRGGVGSDGSGGHRRGRRRGAGADGSADLVSEGRLELPGGQVSIHKSIDDRFLVGVELPPGAGTYGVQLCGYGRARAREIWERGMRDASPSTVQIAESLRGVERYRFRLWQVATEPRWPDDDDDD